MEKNKKIIKLCYLQIAFYVVFLTSLLLHFKRGLDHRAFALLIILTLLGCASALTLTDYLKKNPVNNMVYVCGQSVDGAKFAELEYEVKEEKNGLAFALVTLHTGRSHQIRVQMSHMGTPVYGDMRYGGDKAKKGRLALWATTLAFTHPVSKQRLCFKVEPPKDELPWKYFDTSVVVDPYEAL